MKSIEDAVRRRSERGTYRDPAEVLAAVHQRIAASAQGDAPLGTPTQTRFVSLEDSLLTTADPPYAPEVARNRQPYRRLVGAAAALLVVGLTGLLVIQNHVSDTEAPVAAEGELPTPSTDLTRDTPGDPLPSLVRHLPNERVPAVEVLRLEGGYSLQAAWESDLCISTRHGDAVGSTCAPAEYLNDTLLGITSHLGDRPGYFISGAVGPEITHVRATIADSGDRSIQVVGHSAFTDIRFFLLYIAPDERLEDLRAVTRDRVEYPVMDLDRLASLVDRVEENLGE